MKINTQYFCLIILFFFISTLKAQLNTVGVPFILSLPPSANLNAAGGAFAALPTDDPFGFYYNPAQLGQFSQNSNAAIQFDRRNWTAFGLEDLHFFNLGISTGYNFKNINEKLPLSIGVGYMIGYWSLGENIWTDETGAELGTFKSREYYNAFGIGACYNIFLKASVGLTYKHINSNLGQNKIGDVDSNSGKSNAFDFGLMLNIPFTKLFNPDRLNREGLYPILELNYGYSILNVGEEIYYLDKSQADPLPRFARLGNAIKFGLGKRTNGININIFTFEYSSESNDILVTRDTSGAFKYDDIFGDISFFNSLFLWDDGNKVIVRRGLSLDLYEILQFSMGFIDQPDYQQVKPFGLAVSVKGILKSISMFSGKPGLDNFINHMDVKFAYTNLNLNSNDPLDNKDFWGINFTVYGY